MGGTKDWVCRAAIVLFYIACASDKPPPLPEKADSGFQIERDAFVFENFGGGYDSATMNATMAARMFGAANVCVPGSDPCVAIPAAQAWIDTANEAMALGHCEGLAVLAQLFHIGALKAQDFGAATPRELNLADNFGLQREIAYWFATQLVPNAVTSKALLPRDAISFMAEYLKPGATEFFRIGMAQRTDTGFGQAHSLTPIGFVRGERTGLYYVRVYDNNFPAQERQLKLDVDANTWEYQGVNDTGPVVYSGGASTKNPLYFAASKARMGELPCPFCSDEQRMITVRGAAPLATDGNGETGFKNGELVQAPGSSLSAGFALCASSGATVVMSTKASKSAPLTLSLGTNGSTSQSVKIQGGGSLGTVALKGDLSTTSAAQIQTTGDEIKIQSAGASTKVSFQVGGTTVTVAVSGNAGDVKVSRDPTTGKIAIDTSNAMGAKVEVQLDNGSGGTKTSYSVPAGDGTTSVDLPKDGWTGSTPPAVQTTAGGMNTAVKGDLCGNLVLDSGEIDVDCGGPNCPKCVAGKKCVDETGCVGGSCSLTKKCATLSTNGVKDGAETDIDCGGTVSEAPRCTVGKSCVLASDCEPNVRCGIGSVCRKYPSVGGSISPRSENVLLSLTPKGKPYDQTVDNMTTSDRAGNFSFRDTLVTTTYQVDVVRSPTDNICSVTSPGSWASPDAVTGIVVTCVPFVQSCANGAKDNQETDIDCGGADCTPRGKPCAGGKSCLVDRDCGAPSERRLCLTATSQCGATFDIEGTASVVVPVTLELTPGGTLGGASATPLAVTIQTADRTFKFENTRVTGTYAVAMRPQAGVTCTLTNASGTASANVTNATVSCLACGNGAKEGTETDVDCGGAACVALGRTCGAGKVCNLGSDCASGSCVGSMCVAAGCSNGVKDNLETDVDCGGTTCVMEGKKCGVGKSCSVVADCTTNLCNGMSCAAPGSTWSAVASTFGSAGSTVVAATALSATNAWAASGEDVAQYNGMSWTTVAKPFAGFTVRSLFASSNMGNDQVWAGAVDNVFKEYTLGGGAWFSRLSGLAGGSPINAIHGAGSTVLLVSSEGKIARRSAMTGDFADEFGGGGGMPGLPGGGGPAPTAEDLYGVFVLDDNAQYAVGANGAIVKYSGALWSLQGAGVTTATLRAVWASSENNVWAVGDSGVVVRYNGINWATVVSGTANNLATVWGEGSSAMWIAGDTGLIRYWSGGALATEATGTAQNLKALFGVAGTRWAVGANQTFLKRN